MSYSGTSDTHLEDLLAAVTDALLAEDDNVDAILVQYNVPRAQFEGAVYLIRRLHVALVGVHPSRRFVRRLRVDLIGQQGNPIVNRIRYLPPRVQIAAGVALLAGFMILSRRRLVADAEESITPEIAAAR